MAQAAKSTRAHKPVGTDVSTARRVSRLRRHTRLRKRVNGTPERPRLVVNRSARHIHVQVVDDTAGRTVVSASTMDASRGGPGRDRSAPARRVGALVAERAQAAGITAVVFDRGGNRYAGRIAALAASAREGGRGFGWPPQRTRRGTTDGWSSASRRRRRWRAAGTS